MLSPCLNQSENQGLTLEDPDIFFVSVHILH